MQVDRQNGRQDRQAKDKQVDSYVCRQVERLVDRQGAS
jgi:hypothetical protein